MKFEEIKLEVIAIRIKQKRKECKLSQDALAELSELNKLTIWNFENCQVEDPKLKTLGKIAKGLNCRVEELLY